MYKINNLFILTYLVLEILQSSRKNCHFWFVFSKMTKVLKIFIIFSKCVWVSVCSYCTSKTNKNFKKNFLSNGFKWRLRYYEILVEIGPKIRGGSKKIKLSLYTLTRISCLINRDKILHSWLLRSYENYYLDRIDRTQNGRRGGSKKYKIWININVIFLENLRPEIFKNQTASFIFA